jgi:uncharacterized protein YndB with AHSA1/START domain
VPDEPLDPIILQVTVPLAVDRIHAALLDPGKVGEWIGGTAEIEPRIGGRYTLHVAGETPFVSEGRITALTPALDLGFSWQGPEAFANEMNRPDPRTRVYFRLQDSPEGIDITLEHDGWGAGDAWEEARSFHFRFWDDRLHRLKEFLLREAYG